MTSFNVTLRSSASFRFQETVAAPLVQTNLFKTYQLQWRQQILFVSLHESASAVAPAPVAQLVSRLTHSSVRCVCIDPSVGEAHVTAWADACQQAGKVLYLRTAKGKTASLSPWAQQLMNAVLNPIFVAAASVLNTPSAEPVLYKQWCVGQRGQLFQSWQFRAMGTALKNV
ncbi:MAG: hypothetical protein VKL39_17060 [Leptolyngbyaceae bacterium]|nr:hypothetical protein [Leptolyngbyaceae bacterium]